MEKKRMRRERTGEEEKVHCIYTFLPSRTWNKLTQSDYASMATLSLLITNVSIKT